MSGLIGKKIGMTSVYNADGQALACTVIETGPCVVTQVRSVEKDGYTAVQLGYGDKKEKHSNKPELATSKERVPRLSVNWLNSKNSSRNLL